MFLNFRVFQRSMSEEQEKAIKESLEKLLTTEGRKVTVDWNFFHELESKKDKYLGGQIYSAAVDKLRELNILSLKQEGNYFIVGCNMIINPSVRMFLLYFTRKGDVDAYKEIAYNKTMYSTSIGKGL